MIAVKVQKSCSSWYGKYPIIYDGFFIFQVGFTCFLPYFWTIKPYHSKLCLQELVEHLEVTLQPVPSELERIAKDGLGGDTIGATGLQI